ncbi:MAG TPA: arginase [Candidatus Acidoferrales bacterium]|nr:arginase [Candidatus Acidoferrales bacterium]
MPQKIRMIGVPMDLGASRRGVDMGPSALRVGGIAQHLKAIGHQVEDIGNVLVKQPEEQHYGEKRAKYMAEIVETSKGLAQIVEKALEEGQVPLVLGGDHSVALGTVGGVSSYFRKRDKRVGLVWLDAHADMNTPESSPSGNIHGMPLAAIAGYGPDELTQLAGPKPMVNPRNISLVGVRDIDARERKIIKESGVHVFTMRDLDERGMREVMAEALRFAQDETDGVCVSLDLDFVDPTDAPGVGTPVRGGVTYREAHLAMEMIADTKGVVSLEIVEVNPVIDQHNQTAMLGIELVLSGLGKKIL